MMDTLYYRKVAEIAHRDGGDAMRDVAIRVLAVGRETAARIRRSDKRTLKAWMRQWCDRKMIPHPRDTRWSMNCRKCGKAMYREDIDMGNGLEEAWHCPDRLDGEHGEWLSMPVFVMRVSAEEFDRISEMIGEKSADPGD